MFRTLIIFSFLAIALAATSEVDAGHSKKVIEKKSAHKKKIAPIKSRKAHSYQNEPTYIISLTNAHRHKNKVSSLIENKFISQVAQEHAEEMARKGKISHDGFDQRFKKIRSKMPMVSGMGENVAMNKNVKNPPEKAVDQWKKSPGHNKNMLNKDFRYIGIGVAQAKDGSYYFAQIFAK